MLPELNENEQMFIDGKPLIANPEYDLFVQLIGDVMPFLNDNDFRKIRIYNVQSRGTFVSDIILAVKFFNDNVWDSVKLLRDVKLQGHIKDKFELVFYRTIPLHRIVNRLSLHQQKLQDKYDKRSKWTRRFDGFLSLFGNFGETFKKGKINVIGQFIELSQSFNERLSLAEDQIPPDSRNPFEVKAINSSIKKVNAWKKGPASFLSMYRASDFSSGCNLVSEFVSNEVEKGARSSHRLCNH